MIRQIPVADTSLQYQRSGTVSYVVDDQIYTGSITMTWQGDSRCAFSVTGLFGLSLLDLETHGDTVNLIQGDHIERFNTRDSVAKIGFFEDYPFTFGQAIRIISGSYIRTLHGLGSPDSSFYEKNRQVLVWHADQETIRMKVKKGGRVPDEVNVIPTTGSSVVISLSGFADGLASKVSCVLDSGNSFSVHYRHAKINK